MGLKAARRRRARGKVLDRRTQVVRIQNAMRDEWLRPGRLLMVARTGAIGEVLAYQSGELTIRWD